MSFLLTNPSALSALQSLQQTQNNLANVQNEVSTGLSVQNASQNAAYWSISQQLTSDNGVVNAATSAMSQTQSTLTTANNAIQSVISTIQSIQTTLTQAESPNANITALNTTLQGLSSELTDAVNGASFDGINLLNGSQTAAINFVSGFNATQSGGTLTTISFPATNLLNTAPAAGTSSLTAATGVANATTDPTPAAYDLTNLGTTDPVSTANAADMLNATMAALNSVQTYAAQIGTTLDRVNNAINLNGQLSTNYQDGIAGLVDANMNTASTQLQALQTQEQLGIQALSIANQNSQLILKLFNG
jgi:flagellin